MEESFAALMESSAAVKDIPGEDPVDRLKRGMWAYANFGLRNQDHYRFAFLLQHPDSARSPKAKPAFEGLRSRIKNCIDAGRFQPKDADLTAQSLWAAVHGVTSLLILKPAFPWVARRKLIARVIDSAVEALVASRKQSESQ